MRDYNVVNFRTGAALTQLVGFRRCLYLSNCDKVDMKSLLVCAASPENVG